jgi:hypothetical protein
MRATAVFRTRCASASASSKRAASSSSASFKGFCRKSFSAATQQSSRNELIWKASNPARPNGNEIFGFFMFIQIPGLVCRASVHWSLNTARNSDCQPLRTGRIGLPHQFSTPLPRPLAPLPERLAPNSPLILSSSSRPHSTLPAPAVLPSLGRGKTFFAKNFALDK